MIKLLSKFLAELVLVTAFCAIWYCLAETPNPRHELLRLPAIWAVIFTVAETLQWLARKIWSNNDAP